MAVSDDLRIALELEARIIKASGLLIPGRCMCRHWPITSYPGRPWYFVDLGCAHVMRKMRPNLNNPGQQPGAKRAFGWFTGCGERVSTAQLEAAFDKLRPHAFPNRKDYAQWVISTNDGAEVNRFGGVYYNNFGQQYAEPG